MLMVGILDIYLATSLALFPSRIIGMFNISSDGLSGHSAYNIQLAGLLLLAGFCLLLGTWRRNADLMVVPAMLFGIVFLAGVANQIVPHTFPVWWLPKTTDVIHLGWLHIVLAIVAWHLLPHPGFYESEA